MSGLLSVSVSVSMWSLIVSTGVGFVILLFVKQDLRRKNVDENSKILVDYDSMLVDDS